MFCWHAGVGYTRRSLWHTLFLLALLVLSATPSLAQFSIDTIPFWNGTQFISSFGVPNTATYGQTITVSAGVTPLNSFSVEIGNCGADVTMRGEVYAWNGTMATGPALFESAPYTLPNSSSFQLVTFSTGGLTLPAGTYVLFASTSRDQAGAPNSACRWGSVADTAYPGGNFVFLNNGANPALWTSGTWSAISYDLAMRVNGLTNPVPAASTTSLLIGFALLLGAALFALSRSRQARTS
jgi:hypothetical protein